MDKLSCFLCALLLLTVPLDWLLAAALAAIFHEMCHIIAIILLGGKIWGVRISPGGAIIETSAMTPGKELFCTLCGPMGSLLLISICRWIPKVSICASVQALYNLLPLYPLDGGRALRCLTVMLASEEKAEIICRVVEKVFISIAALLVFLASIRFHLGIIPFIWTLALFGKAIMRKIPCKDGKLGVQ